MSIVVESQLILEASDRNLPTSSGVTEDSYPNRVITAVPGELSALIDRASVPQEIPGEDERHYRELAQKIVKGALGDSWRVENHYYVSGSQEIVSGDWRDGAGFAYRIIKDDLYYEQGLSGVKPECVCRYLLSMRRVVGGLEGEERNVPEDDSEPQRDI